MTRRSLQAVPLLEPGRVAVRGPNRSSRLPTDYRPTSDKVPTRPLDLGTSQVSARRSRPRAYAGRGSHVLRSRRQAGLS